MRLLGLSKITSLWPPITSCIEALGTTSHAYHQLCEKISPVEPGSQSPETNERNDDPADDEQTDAPVQTGAHEIQLCAVHIDESEAVAQPAAEPEAREARTRRVRLVKKDVAQHFKGGNLSAGFCEDERQPLDLNCDYWLILGERGSIVMKSKAYHLYGEKLVTTSGPQPNQQRSMWVVRVDMAFFPMDVFQVYEPVACKTFFDQHSHVRPAQIVVHTMSCCPDQGVCDTSYLDEPKSKLKRESFKAATQRTCHLDQGRIHGK